MKKEKKNLRVLTGTAILAALVIILQLFVSIPLGAFTVTLTLVPIIIGAMMYGTASGAFLGGVFGVIVCLQVITGAAGVLSYEMFVTHPVITLAICMLKGILAGLCPALIFKALNRVNKWLGVVCAAISAPIVNTGIFVAALFAFYMGLMSEFATANAFADAVSFIFLGIVGLNFLVEFAINVLLIPAILSIIRAVKANSKA